MVMRQIYPGKIPLPFKSELWTPGMGDLIRGNYVHAYLNATPHELKMGRQFYPMWHEDAQHLGQRLADVGGVVHPAVATHVAASAMFSHMSPSNEAELNRIQGYQLVHMVEQGQRDHLIHHLTAAAEHASIKSRIGSLITRGEKSGAYPKGSAEHAEMRENYEAHDEIVKHHRKMAEIVGTPLGMNTSEHIVKALNALSSEHPYSELADKTLDFAGSIADPENFHRAPIDTHWHDLGLGRTDVPYDQGRNLTNTLLYNIMSEHSQRAHEEAGTSDAMPQFMGVGWYVHQHRKAVENPASLTMRKITEGRIRNILANKQFQPFLPGATGMPMPENRVNY